MDNQVIYIVTQYGCNSTPSDMWTPESKLFINYDEAYAYFLEVSPSLDDEYNTAEQFINSKYKEEITKDYIVIENRVQITGYDCEERYRYAKRPQGAVISMCTINKSSVV